MDIRMGEEMVRLRQEELHRAARTAHRVRSGSPSRPRVRSAVSAAWTRATVWAFGPGVLVTRGLLRRAQAGALGVETTGGGSFGEPCIDCAA